MKLNASLRTFTQSTVNTTVYISAFIFWHVRGRGVSLAVRNICRIAFVNTRPENRRTITTRGPYVLLPKLSVNTFDCTRVLRPSHLQVIVQKTYSYTEHPYLPSISLISYISSTFSSLKTAMTLLLPLSFFSLCRISARLQHSSAISGMLSLKEKTKSFF